jgi:hypothetical protein
MFLVKRTRERTLDTTIDRHTDASTVSSQNITHMYLVYYIYRYVQIVYDLVSVSDYKALTAEMNGQK